MRRFLTALVLTSALLPALAACATAPPPLTAQQVADALGTSGMPVTATVVYTAENDENKLLGRPGQYTGKVNWTDARTGTNAPLGATVETFADRATLDARVTYLTPITKAALFAQYMHAHPTRPALMRLPHELSPEQASAYEAWFDRLGS